jgi:hypothetical protein
MGRSLSTPALNAGVSTVASATGFAAGDYVYQMQTNASGTIPAGALATGTFDYNGISSSINPTSSTNNGNLNYVELNGGSTGGQAAAKLNNGNIVLVYCKNTPSLYLKIPYFKIVDSTGATVVAETAVSTATVGGKNSVSVCVLPNNNFVVCFSYSAAAAASPFQLAYRIFQENGTVVTAAIIGSVSFTSNTASSGSLIKIKPRSDNSFIMMAYDGKTVRFQAANAAGFLATFFAGAASYQKTLLSDNGGQYADFAIRSDNTIHIFYVLNQGQLSYDVLSSTGAVTATGNIGSVIQNIFCVSCTLMPSGSVNVFYYGIDTTGCFIGGYSWNGTAATFIARVVSFTTALTPTFTFLNSYAQGGAGNFTLFYSHIDTLGALTYQTFNSSGVVLSGSVARTIPSISYPLGQEMQLSVFDIGSETRAYMTGRANSNGAATASFMLGYLGGVFYFAYNSTSYNLNVLSTISYNYGNFGSIPLGAVVPASSTVIETAFTVAATGSYPQLVTAGTNLVGKTTIFSETTGAVGGTPLQNGNFAVSWLTSTNGNLYLRTYTPLGVEVATIIVATGLPTGTKACPVATFANGNFVLVYGSAATTLTYKIYNPSLTELFTGTVSANANFASNGSTFKTAAYGDCTQVAIVYQKDAGAGFIYEVKEITSAGVLTTIFTGAVGSAENFQLTPHKSNSFTIWFRESPGGTFYYYGQSFYKTAPTSFTVGAALELPFGDKGLNQFVSGPVAPGPSNNIFSVINNTSTSSNYIINTEPLYSGNYAQYNYWITQASGYQFNFSTGHALGYSGNGAAVWATSRGSAGGFIYYINVRSLNLNNPFVATYGNGSVVNTGLQASGTNISMAVIPNVEGAVTIVYIDGSEFPAFFIPVIQNSYISKTFTAGTDVSSSKLMLTPERGYSLLGVAITAATAGSTGLVQTKGTATLNASYSAVTPYTPFDFRSSITNGVRGSVTGLTVTLEGQ